MNEKDKKKLQTGTTASEKLKEVYEQLARDKFKEDFKEQIKDYVKIVSRKSIAEATDKDRFSGLAYAVKEMIVDRWIASHKAIEQQDLKIVYYLSMEFLIGRLLGNTIINLSVGDIIKEAIEELDINLNAVEDEEPDPALGNGGLGRLAACFLDSLSTLGYPAYGCGIRYHYGMFEQKIIDGYQVEVPDEWLRNGNPFEIRCDECEFEIKFGGNVVVKTDEKGRNHFDVDNYNAVKAIGYDMPVVGYGETIVNTLRIWDAQPVQRFVLDSFNKGDYAKATEEENLAKTICEVLYPCDEHMAGKELRLKQQYFFVSASVQNALKKYMRNHDDIHKLHEKVVFQMNDTHPTICVPELMRILMDDYFLEWDEAWEITNKTCAYTNHTIMAEALEKWPIDLFSSLLPRCYQIIEEINRRFEEQIKKIYPNNEEKLRKMLVIYDGQIRMANMAIVASFSVNGVARLHTEILKKQELKDFYEMMPEKFNNKTNGITQRRFLLHANPLLSEWVTKKVGDSWITDLSKIKGIIEYANDPVAQAEFMEIKYKNKLRLAEYIKKHNGIDINPNSIFDVQVKRLHEYKRQLLNILHVMHLYNEIKERPDMDFYPRTFIFGAKAAAGYKRAKMTIKLINSVADVINNDKSINNKIKVVFIENYRVSNAELIFAAADISEQISTASKEASGTGNMKFMLNGAITIGTLDGANVEIVEEVGEENAFIFGLKAEEVINYENNHNYDPMEIFNNDMDIRKVLMQLINGTYSPDDTERFREIYNSLLNTKSSQVADTYFILKDFKDYVRAQKEITNLYEHEKDWAKAAIINVACSGKFSSDRTIEEYANEIWKLTKVEDF